MRVNWKPGSVVVPPNQWFHQHFNSGANPARYLALRWNSWRYKFAMFNHEDSPSDKSVKQGGAQIEYEDEDPKIHATFEEALTKSLLPLPDGTCHPLVHAEGSKRLAVLNAMGVIRQYR